MPLEALTRRYASPRKLILLLTSLAAVIILFICLCRTFNLHNSPSKLLGVADNIYVISLGNRHRRREDMEKLRLSLELRWTYVDALEADSPLVHRIMDWVKAIRTGPPHILNERNTTPEDSRLLPDSIYFAWPGDIETHVTSRTELDLWSTGIWSSPTGSFKLARYFPVPVACAAENYSLIEHTTRPKEHLILTYPRIACWHSHLTVIHDIANNAAPGTLGVAIILEDDVDMEKDIHKQLAYLWLSLPADWDIVFLGHCWSDETGNGLQPLGHTINISSVNSRLYVARKPKCTHAYALSRTGARRLLLHLRYPPFAYSRAIDQAISWLVESGRLKGFSVVPSVVIQRKVTESDVIPGNGMGSRWKDSLTEGFFEDSRLKVV